MTARESFDELVSSYLDDALDAEGQAELNALIATRPDYAARFATLAGLHGALYRLAGHPRVADRSLLERSFTWIAGGVLVGSFVCGIAATMGWGSGQVLMGLVGLGLGFANGMGASEALWVDRFWFKRELIVERCVNPGAYWTLVAVMILCTLFGTGWGLGVWLGWFPWR